MNGSSDIKVDLNGKIVSKTDRLFENRNNPNKIVINITNNISEIN